MFLVKEEPRQSIAESNPVDLSLNHPSLSPPPTSSSSFTDHHPQTHTTESKRERHRASPFSPWYTSSEGSWKEGKLVALPQSPSPPPSPSFPAFGSLAPERSEAYMELPPSQLPESRLAPNPVKKTRSSTRVAKTPSIPAKLNTNLKSSSKLNKEKSGGWKNVRLACDHCESGSLAARV
ncbi:hypothetical protein IAR50_001168 [Cryptococcus sp. DSM 104548]